MSRKFGHSPLPPPPLVTHCHKILFLRMCEVTLLPDPLPPQNDVTNCHNLGTPLPPPPPPPPLRRDVIFERPQRQMVQPNSFQKTSIYRAHPITENGKKFLSFLAEWISIKSTCCPQPQGSYLHTTHSLINL